MNTFSVPRQLEKAMTNGLEAAAQTFIESGEVEIYLPLSELVDPLIDALVDLIEDKEHRGAWSLKIDRPGEPDDEPDDGLIRKNKNYDPSSPLKDSKWYFHYRPSLRKHLLNHGVRIGKHGELLRTAALAYNVCRSAMRSFTRACDRVDPSLQLTDLTSRPAAEEMHVLRILWYDTGVNIGKPHTDRAAITLHAAENRPALHRGPKRVLYVARPNRAIVFASQKMGRLSRNRTPAVEHDVVDKTPDKIGERSAIIFFTQISNLDLP